MYTLYCITRPRISRKLSAWILSVFLGFYWADFDKQGLILKLRNSSNQKSRKLRARECSNTVKSRIFSLAKFKIPLWNYNSITIIQQHLIIMRYSCRHCQRIDFVEPKQAPMASQGLIGPRTSLKNPVEEVSTPSEGGEAATGPGC